MGTQAPRDIWRQASSHSLRWQESLRTSTPRHLKVVLTICSLWPELETALEKSQVLPNPPNDSGSTNCYGGGVGKGERAEG